ncbi:MAG: hypothetical protein M1829_000004 [Trizodia sp. TS-e1964]|nr:MAG: hypothetical protein M1829_000004 [Trizodia sp. TS-e1964]
MCALGDEKLVCFGGMSPVASASGSQTPALATQQSNAQDAQPEVVVMSDIHVYDVPKQTWSYISTSDTPQGRYAHCATILASSSVFSSANAALSAIHHNQSSTGNPNQGSLGLSLDGSGGAEMIVVGGQDSGNHYIGQISVFNLRSLKWTSTSALGKSCGAYRSVVAPLTGISASRIGLGTSRKGENSGSAIGREDTTDPDASMLIYSNYNFLDVKLELQVRLPDGTLTEKPMNGHFSPPGLRFPNGGVVDKHFVVSGTYLTSSKQEYALWALDLKTLSWSRIDSGGNVFSQGSWNRGVLWNRRNTFVVLGNRKRSLVEDYNHRRINFSHVCMVELEAFGLYENPRRNAPMSGYISGSSPFPTSIAQVIGNKAGWTGGGRQHSSASDELGKLALGLRELSDMDLLAVGGERIPVNSHTIARRWGPYFIQLLKEGAAIQDSNGEVVALRPQLASSQASRHSSVTITPSVRPAGTQSSLSSSTAASAMNAENLQPPDTRNLPASTRPRTLYLPHTHLTLQTLVHFLYTSSLPPPNHPLATPQILCSLLQIARPYHIDGLLEATVERLHQVMDSRNAAAVFNAAAMAAGGGRGISFSGESLIENYENAVTLITQATLDEDATKMAAKTRELRIDTSVTRARAHSAAESHDGTGAAGDDDLRSATSSTTASTTSTSPSPSPSPSPSLDPDNDAPSHKNRSQENQRDVWNGDMSLVVGLQKRGLRGLMEGRRMRERGRSHGERGGRSRDDGAEGGGMVQSTAAALAAAAAGSAFSPMSAHAGPLTTSVGPDQAAVGLGID